MAQGCITRLLDPEIQKKLFGDREMPKKLIEQFVKDIEEMKRLSDQDGISFNTRVQKYIKEHRELTEMQQNIKMHNLEAKRQVRAHLGQDAFKENPVEAARNLLVPSNLLANGSTDHVEFRMNKFKSDWTKMLYGQLEKGQLTKMFVSGEIDGQVREAMWAIRKGAEAPPGVSQEAKEIGRILVDTHKKMLVDQRAYGIPVRELEVYTGMQTHNSEHVAKVGAEKWKADVRQLNLDREWMFGTKAGNREAEDKILQEMYDKIVAGKIGDDAAINTVGIEDEFTGVGYTKSAMKKLTENRYLRFADASSEHAYNSSYGRGTLSETMIASLQRKSRLLALTSKFGTNPDAAFRAMLDEQYQALMGAGREDLAKQIKPNFSAPGDAAYNKTLINTYNEVAGYSNIPANETIARIGATTRNWQMLAKFGQVGFASMTNTAQTAMQIKSNTGKNLFGSLGEVFKGYAGSLGAENRTRQLMQLDFFVDDLLRQVQYQSMTGADQLMHKGLALQSKVTGLDYWTSGAKIAFANAYMKEAADQVTNGALSVDFKKSLLAGGFQEADIPLLKHGIQEAVDGRKLLTAEGLRNIPQDLAAARAKSLGLTPEKYLLDMERKYASIINAGGNISSTTAGARQFGVTNLGTQAGTIRGEITRAIMQFKQFGLQGYDIINSVLNSAPDQQALAKGVLVSRGINAESASARFAQKNWQSMSQLFVMATAMGYIRMMVQDTIAGKPVKNPENYETWLEAMGKSGVGGLYGDMLFSESQKYGGAGFWGSMMGPTFGQAVPLGKAVVEDAIRGNSLDKKTKLEIVKQLRQNMPLQNVPLLRKGFDYLHYDVINEQLNPGSKARNKIRMMRDDREQRLNYTVPILGE